MQSLQVAAGDPTPKELLRTTDGLGLVWRGQLGRQPFGACEAGSGGQQPRLILPLCDDHLDAAITAGRAGDLSDLIGQRDRTVIIRIEQNEQRAIGAGCAGEVLQRAGEVPGPVQDAAPRHTPDLDMKVAPHPQRASDAPQQLRHSGLFAVPFDHHPHPHEPLVTSP